MHPTIFSLLLTSLSLLPSSTSLPPHRPPPPQQPLSTTLTTTHQPPLHHPTTFFELSATCIGRQFDRIFGIWLDGIELLRSCTAEPTREGIVWHVRKDITKYSSSLLSNSSQTVAVYIGNLVDKTYTGVYHVNLTFHYYPFENSENGGVNHENFGELYGNSANLILPISRNLPLNDGLWFEIQNSTDFQGKEVLIPRNVYRAVLEVYVSFHENDEFWYTNLPNDYLVANNMSSQQPGNGAFREVLVSLDGDLVGSIWPFTVIFTGGINPLLWRPITAIGSFDLPSYDIEITPFLGNLLDGKPHSYKFSVMNALNVWYIDANLHLWLDNNVEVLKGKLLENSAEPIALSSKSNFKGLDGIFFTGASRSIISRGWVESSKGNITTISIQKFDFSNVIVLRNDGVLQTVNQTIHFNTSVSANTASSTPVCMIESIKKFPLFLYTNQLDLANNSYSLLSNVTLGFDEDKKTLSAGSGVSSSTLRNHQKGEGTMVVKDNLVQSGLGSTHQVYKYNENNGGLCYFRNVSSYNYTIVFDDVKSKCEAVTRDVIPPLAIHHIFQSL
ncbi:Peptide-N4-(N-acetyl-beta-glucosaminyl)asparagine amidase A [Bienertia sinuspersici]